MRLIRLIIVYLKISVVFEVRRSRQATVGWLFQQLQLSFSSMCFIWPKGCTTVDKNATFASARLLITNNQSRETEWLSLQLFLCDLTDAVIAEECLQSSQYFDGQHTKHGWDKKTYLVILLQLSFLWAVFLHQTKVMHGTEELLGHDWIFPFRSG